MAAKGHKLDRFIKVTDKLAESKGISTVFKSLDKTLNIAGSAIEAAADVTNHQLDERNKRHLTDVKVPNISGLNLAQTRELFDSLDIKYALVAETAHAKYADKQVDTVLRTAPRANSVLAAGSFVKVIYLDEAALSASQALAQAIKDRKQVRSDATKAVVSKIGHGAASGATNVLKATTSLPKKLSKQLRPVKPISATIIDVPAEPKTESEE